LERLKSHEEKVRSKKELDLQMAFQRKKEQHIKDQEKAYV
jgi:hypothetical protein